MIPASAQPRPHASASVAAGGIPVGQAPEGPAGLATTASHVVDVWSAWVGHGPRLDADLEVLDVRERERADRFRSDLDRARFVARHAFFRRVLSGYLGMAPDAIAIRTTAEGRPMVAAAGAFDFNTSHADGLAVIAIGRGRRVGIDIERLRELDDAPDLADAHLTGAELADFRGASPSARSRAFLGVWTRKEAVVKAMGGGLAIPLTSFDTGPIDGSGPRPVAGLEEGRAYVVAPLEGLTGHVGSVALEGAHIEVRDRTTRAATR